MSYVNMVMISDTNEEEAEKMMMKVLWYVCDTEEK